jgi:hypothetical protein
MPDDVCHEVVSNLHAVEGIASGFALARVPAHSAGNDTLTMVMMSGGRAA